MADTVSFIRATSSLKRFGFTRKAAAPFLRQKLRSSAALLVVRMATGMFASGASQCASISSTSLPLFTGMFKSRKIKSGSGAAVDFNSKSKDTNSPPFLTRCITKACPDRCNASAKRSWSSESSSAEIIKRGVFLMLSGIKVAKVKQMREAESLQQQIVPIVTGFLPFLLSQVTDL
jgi:hypothetical protein